MSAVRVDRWLCATRTFKSRTVAGQACAAGGVRVNGEVVKASQLVRAGDRVSAKCPRGLRVLEVVQLAEKRLSAPAAAELFVDHSPAPPPKLEGDAARAQRDRGAGRPTKAERRAIDKFRRR